MFDLCMLRRWFAFLLSLGIAGAETTSVKQDNGSELRIV
jgi:hypothetical protein